MKRILFLVLSFISCISFAQNSQSDKLIRNAITNRYFNGIVKQGSIAQLRAMSPNSADLSTTYFCTEAGKEGNFKADFSDNSSVDNLGTILVCSNGVRLKRVVGNYVVPEWFGAKGDGINDDATAINKAIESSIELGLTCQLNGKIYLIGSSILLGRGGKLKGSVNIDDSNGTVIKLKNGANCIMLKAGRAISNNNSSFMTIEGIIFDGNSSMQTIESDGVEFWGQYVGSYMKNIFIKNVFGIALSLSSGIDLQIDHLWLLGNKSSSGYALSINKNGTSGYDGDVNMSHIYVEYQRKTTNPQLDVYSSANDDKRCTPIYANRVISLTINTLHTEYTGGAILYNNCLKSKIDGYVGYDTGYSSGSENHGVFEAVDQNGIINFTLLNAHTPYRSSNFIWFKMLSGSNNNVTPSPVNVPRVLRFESNTESSIQSNSTPELLITNRLKIQGSGSYSPNYLMVENSAGKGLVFQIADYIADIKMSANQPSANYKSFLQFQSFGNNADRIVANTPIYLYSKADASFMDANAIFVRSGRPEISWGANKSTSIATYHPVTSTPSYIPDVTNQFAFDNTNRKLYFSTGSASSADWNSIVSLTGGNLILGTNTNVNSSILTISSTTQGVLLPRLTTTERDAIISPVEGLEIYNLTIHTKEFYNGTGWKSVTTN